MIYADVSQGQVVNTMVADPDFEAAFAAAFPDDLFIGPLDDLTPQPGIGWTYVANADGSGTFTSADGTQTVTIPAPDQGA